MELKLHGIDVWNRATIADGSKLNATTISPLFKNDCILASAVNSYVASGADFSATEWPVMRDSVIPSANNYASYFSNLSNSAKWNSTIDTVNEHFDEWSGTHKTVNTSKSYWNATVASAQSGYAASAWLANNTMEVPELKSEAVSYAPDGQWNAAANYSMLLHQGSPEKNNEKYVQSVYSNNKSFTIKGNRTSILGTNVQSNISVQYVGNSTTTSIKTNSIAHEYQTTNYETTNSLAMCSHRNGSYVGPIIDSLTNSYVGSNDLNKSIAIGPNNLTLENTLSTTYGQEIHSAQNSILSWKGGKLYNCIAIKGSLWQKYDCPKAHIDYANDSNVPEDGTVSAINTLSEYEYENSYLRNIKGLNGERGHATCYPFIHAYESVVMTSGGQHHDYYNNTNDITRSLFSMNNGFLSEYVSVWDSLAMTSAVTIGKGKNYGLWNAIVLGHNFDFTDSNNSLLIAAEPIVTEDGGQYCSDFKEVGSLDIGGLKNTITERTLNVASNCYIDAVNSLYAGGRFQVDYFTDAETRSTNNFIIGEDFHANTQNSMGVLKHSEMKESKYLLTIANSGKDYWANNSLSIRHAGDTDSLTNSVFNGNNFYGSSLNNTLVIGYAPSNKPYSLIDCSDSIVMGSFHTTKPITNSLTTTDHKVLVYSNKPDTAINCSLVNLWANKNCTFTVTSGMSINLINSIVDGDTEYSANCTRMIANGLIPIFDDSSYIRSTSIKEYRNLLLNQTDSPRLANIISNTILNGYENEIDSVNQSIIVGKTNRVKKQGIKFTSMPGHLIVGDKNYIYDDYYQRVNGDGSIIIGNNFSNDNADTKVFGGIHIGDNLNYDEDSNFTSLIRILGTDSSYIFKQSLGPTKPLILSKSDGVYFVCFKGQFSNEKSPSTHLYFRRKSDGQWYDIVNKQLIG